MLEHLYLPRTGDRDIIRNYIEDFRKLDDTQIQQESVKKKKLGIVGAHQQALNLIAFNIVMKERFNDSPIEIENNCLIRFKQDEK
jgi:hypothetical protein